MERRGKRGALSGNEGRAARVFPLHPTEKEMTKPLTKNIKPVPEENKSPKGPGSAPGVPIDTTKGHRDDEKNNIREQAEHGNLTQNTSNRRSG
jgi:hypothetical protein